MKYLLGILLLISFLSCKQESDKSSPRVIEIAEASIDDELADSLISTLQNTILKDDMKYIGKDSTAFQFFKIDLNNNGSKEIFVRLISPYFCKEADCTFYVLDKSLKVINRFVRAQVPVIATQEFQNDWRILLTSVEGEMKMLINKNNRYPSNPVMALKSDIPISRDDIYMFDDELGKCKTYYFTGK